MRLRFLHRIAVAGTRQANRKLGITFEEIRNLARANSAFRFRRKKIAAGHFLRLRQAEQKKKGGRDVSQDSIFNAKICRVIRDVNEMDQVRGVSGVGRSIGIAHLLAIAMVRRDQGFSA